MTKKKITKRKLTPAEKRMEKKQAKAKKIIKAKIEEALSAKKWKYTDLADAMLKDNVTLVYTWMSGTHNFTVNTLIELETALGINLLADGISVARKKRAASPKKKR